MSFNFLLQVFELFYCDSCFTGLVPQSAMLYQVGLRATLLLQKSYTPGTDYVNIKKYGIKNHALYGKRVFRSFNR